MYTTKSATGIIMPKLLTLTFGAATNIISQITLALT